MLPLPHDSGVDNEKANLNCGTLKAVSCGFGRFDAIGNSSTRSDRYAGCCRTLDFLGCLLWFKSGRSSCDSQHRIQSKRLQAASSCQSLDIGSPQKMPQRICTQGGCGGCLSASNAAPASLRAPSTSALVTAYKRFSDSRVCAGICTDTWTCTLCLRFAGNYSPISKQHGFSHTSDVAGTRSSDACLATCRRSGRFCMQPPTRQETSALCHTNHLPEYFASVWPHGACSRCTVLDLIEPLR